MEAPPVVLPIQLSPAQVRPIAYRVISKKHGLNLKSPALEVLSKFLGHHFGADWRSQQAEKSLDEISKRWKEEDRGIFVDGPPLAQVIKDYLNAESATQNSNGSPQSFDWRQYFKVVNTNDQRRLVYDRNKKNFTVPEAKQGNDIPQPFGGAAALTNVFASRYNILKDKLYRNDMFQPSGLATSSDKMGFAGQDSQVYTISPVKNMLGRSIGTEFFLFGLLEKQTDGPWTLYDYTGFIPLEFTEESAFRPDHYYTSGSFVICHGHFMGEYLQVVTLGVPPPERREYSQVAYGNIDFYGLNTGKGSRRQTSSRIERIDQSLQHILEAEEGKMPENKVVILGTDIFLDKLPIVDALKRTLFELEKNPPVALILSGSFISSPMQPYMTTNDGRNAAQLYRDGMNTLADIFQQCPEISSKTKVIVVPGPNDPWQSDSTRVIPYNRLPSVFTGRVDRAVENIEWATNPSRLCYLSQEMFLYRGNVGEMLRKYSLDTEAINFPATANSAPGNSNKNGGAPSGGGGNTVGSVSFEVDDVEERDADRAAVNTMIELNDLSVSELTTSNATNDNNEFKRVMATILDQCHISPFSLSKAPVMWEYDQTVSLAQWPTCLVLLDPSTPPAKQVYEGCNVMNPGQFYFDNKANWLEFWPSSGDYRFADLL